MTNISVLAALKRTSPTLLNCNLNFEKLMSLFYTGLRTNLSLINLDFNRIEICNLAPSNVISMNDQLYFPIWLKKFFLCTLDFAAGPGKVKW